MNITIIINLFEMHLVILFFIVVVLFYTNIELYWPPVKRTQLKNLPNVLIIGAQKSGTTFLKRKLSEYEETYVYKGEAHYFDKIKTPTRHEYSNHLLHYRDFNGIYNNPEIINKKIIIEKTPEYLYYPEQIVDNMPANTKYIVTLRNPIDRAYSHYKMLRRNIPTHKWKEYNILSFEEALMKNVAGILYRGKYIYRRTVPRYIIDTRITHHADSLSRARG